MTDFTGIGAVADLAKAVVDKIFPDKSDQERQQLAATLTIIQGQIDTNKQEAANSNIFVAGWRPFIGWVCGSAFAIQYVVGPLGTWLSNIITGHAIQFPVLDLGTMMPLLLGMLGLGGMRTVEKINDVKTGH